MVRLQDVQEKLQESAGVFHENTGTTACFLKKVILLPLGGEGAEREQLR